MQPTFGGFNEALRVHMHDLCPRRGVRISLVTSLDETDTTKAPLHVAELEIRVLVPIGDWHAGDYIAVRRAALTKDMALNCASAGVWLLLAPSSLFTHCTVPHCAVCAQHDRCYPSK